MIQPSVEELMERAQELEKYSKVLCSRGQAIFDHFSSRPDALSRKGKMSPFLQGMRKLNKRLQQDHDFIYAMIADPELLTESKLKSSNLSSFEGMLDVIEAEGDNVCGVWQSFSSDPPASGSKHKKDTVDVDVVTNNGLRWYKVKASQRGLEGEEQTRFGERTVFDQLSVYVRVASSQVIQGRAPQVCAYFPTGVPECVEEELSDMSILLVTKKTLPPPFLPLDALDGEAHHLGLPLLPLPPGDRVNLDVTTMVALCSELTNGACPVRFPDHPVLDAQAVDEASCRVLPGLLEYLNGKVMIVSEKAMAEFKSILDNVGGVKEICRAQEFFQRFHVVPDNPAQHVMKLKETSRIGERQKIIFGTGEAYRAVTVTANKQFIQASKEQGVFLTNHTHPARALTEKKNVVLADQPKVN